jgi:hypothetical protein
VNENSERFFLRTENAVLSSRPLPAGSGTAWCATADAPTVTALRSACEEAGITLRKVVPTAWVLPLTAADDSIEWVDHGGKLSISAKRGVPVAIRRTRVAESDVHGCPAQLAPGLRGLEAEQWNFADAFGAAVSRGSCSLAIHIPRPSAEPHGSPVRPSLIAGLVAAAIVNLLVGPVLVAKTRESRHDAGSDITAVRAREAQRLVMKLEAPVQAAADLHRFRQRRVSVISMLGVLSRALEDDASITALQFRNGEGRMEVSSANVSTTIDALQASDSLREVTLDGPVTSQLQSGTRRDRATIRFRWRTTTPAHPVPVVTEGRRD